MSDIDLNEWRASSTFNCARVQIVDWLRATQVESFQVVLGHMLANNINLLRDKIMRDLTSVLLEKNLT